MIHDHHDLVRIAFGVLLFVIGSVVLARPFCRRRSTLLVAIPIAALVGVVALGVIALLLTLLALATNDFDLPDNRGGMGKRPPRPVKRRRGSGSEQ